MAKVATVCVQKDKSGPIRINKEDLKDWKDKGYSECKPAKVVDPPAGSGEVVISEAMTKNAIMTALEDSKYAAIADKVDKSLTKALMVEQIVKLMEDDAPDGESETEE